MNYPGDTLGRNEEDRAVFDNTSNTACSLNTNLAATIAALQLNPGYTNTVTLGVNVKVRDGRDSIWSRER